MPGDKPRSTLRQSSAPKQTQKPKLKDSLKAQGLKARAQLNKEIKLVKHREFFTYEKKTGAFVMKQNSSKVSLWNTIPASVTEIEVRAPKSSTFYKAKRIMKGKQRGSFQAPKGYPGAYWKGPDGIKQISLFKGYAFRVSQRGLSLKKPAAKKETLPTSAAKFKKGYEKHFTKKGESYVFTQNNVNVNLKNAIDPSVTKIQFQVTAVNKVFTLHRIPKGQPKAGHFKIPKGMPKWVTYRGRMGIYKGNVIRFIAPKVSPKPAPKPAKKPAKAPKKIATLKTKEVSETLSSTFKTKEKNLQTQFNRLTKVLDTYPAVKLPKVKVITPVVAEGHRLTREALARSGKELNLNANQCAKYMYRLVLKSFSQKELEKRGGLWTDAWNMWSNIQKTRRLQERKDGVAPGSYKDKFAKIAGDHVLDDFYYKGGSRIHLTNRASDSLEYKQSFAALFKEGMDVMKRGNLAYVPYYYRGSGNQHKALRSYRKLPRRLRDSDGSPLTHIEPMMGIKEVTFMKKELERTKKSGDLFSVLVSVYSKKMRKSERVAVRKLAILKESGTKIFITNERGQKEEVELLEDNSSRHGYAFFTKRGGLKITTSPSNKWSLSFNDIGTRSYMGPCSWLDNYLRYGSRGVRRLPSKIIEFPGVKWPTKKKEHNNALTKGIVAYATFNPRRRGVKTFRQMYKTVLMKKYGYKKEDFAYYVDALKLVGVNTSKLVKDRPIPVFDIKTLRGNRRAVGKHYDALYQKKAEKLLSANHHVTTIRSGDTPWKAISRVLLKDSAFKKLAPLTKTERGYLIQKVDQVNKTFSLAEKGKGFEKWPLGAIVAVPKDFSTQLIKSIEWHRKITENNFPKGILCGLDSKGKMIRRKVTPYLRKLIKGEAAHDAELQRLMLLVLAREQLRGGKRRRFKRLFSKWTKSKGIFQVRAHLFRQKIGGVPLYKKLTGISSYKKFKAQLTNRQTNTRCAAYLLKKHRASVLRQLDRLAPGYAARNPKVVSAAILSAYSSRPTRITEAVVMHRIKKLQHLLYTNHEIFDPADLKKERTAFFKKYGKSRTSRRWVTNLFGFSRKYEKVGGKIATPRLKACSQIYLLALRMKQQYGAKFTTMSNAQIEKAALRFKSNPIAFMNSGLYKSMVLVAQAKFNGFDMTRDMFSFNDLYKKGGVSELNYGFAVLRAKKPGQRTQYAMLRSALPNTNQLLTPKVPEFRDDIQTSPGGNPVMLARGNR